MRRNNKFRWIVYLNQPMGGFEVERATSLEGAKQLLRNYSRNTGYYHDLQVSGQYGCSAALYPYSDKDWAEAEEYAEIGCPFDYPSRALEHGPRGGVRVMNT